MNFSLDNRSKLIHKLGMAAKINLEVSGESNRVVIQGIRTLEPSPPLAA